jgi:hypothetical protein
MRRCSTDAFGEFSARKVLFSVWGIVGEGICSGRLRSSGGQVKHQYFSRIMRDVNESNPEAA